MACTTLAGAIQASISPYPNILLIHEYMIRKIEVKEVSLSRVLRRATYNIGGRAVNKRQRETALFLGKRVSSILFVTSALHLESLLAAIEFLWVENQACEIS